jgi:radical SAM superfamily enzyme YgiQ (UPF0313 family)
MKRGDRNMSSNTGENGNTDLLLIMPAVNRGHGAMKHEVGRLSSAPLALPYLASLVPPDFDVTIIDENVQEIDFEQPVDLVGISVLTMTAPRAYEIAAEFRERGTPVVMGGTHPTVMPEEAGRHADALVVGEAEGVWQKLLTDFQHGGMKGVYRRGGHCGMENWSLPRWDLMNSRAYLTTNVVQATRGCPYNCAFCSVSSVFGPKYRCRPVKDVIREIEALDGKLLGFVDADIAGNPAYAKELFRALAPYKKIWAGDAGMRVANDEELLSLAAKSGCKGLFIGFESLSPQSLKEAGKSQNTVERYKETVKRITGHGISVLAGFVFGFDTDDESVFERTVEFAIDCKLLYADFNILCPYPGTAVHRKLTEQDRIIETDWSKYFGMYNVVFRPKQMSVDALREGCLWAWKEFYSIKSILKRFLSCQNFTSLVNPIGHIILNAATHRGISRFAYS